jgi:hypothetical protein
LKIPREMFGGGAITQDARPGKLPRRCARYVLLSAIGNKRFL